MPDLNLKEIWQTGYKMLIDTSAWIELFLGTGKGEIVKATINETECFTSIVTIAELTNWCIRNNLENNYYIDIIEKNSIILNLRKGIVLLSGRVNFENKRKIRNWGMLDSFIYATALVYNLQVLTADRHFKGLGNTKIL